MQAHGEIPNSNQWMLHTHNGLVHKAIWTIAYRTKRYMIPLGTSCSFVCWSILDQPCIFSSLFNRWCLEDNHEWSLILFFKAYLQYAQLTYDQSSDNSSNNNLVITYSSSWSYQVYIRTPRWSWCQILHYINIFMASTLNPTYGVQAWSMDKHYK